jgi:diacylglycerol kinase family enzyme
MYLYIYDSVVSNQKYASLVTAIERRVTDLGIGGKIARLTILKNIKELVGDAVKNGVTTIIAVGDDQTFAKVINSVATLDVVLGFIPIESSSAIARTLGIPSRESACDVIAARIVKKLDLGKINNYYFLNAAEITNAKVRITCEGYSIAPMTELNTVRICNIGTAGEYSANPMDGSLEAVITPIHSGWLSKKPLQATVVPFTKIRIESMDDEPVTIMTDEQIILKTPADVEVAPSQLRVIVGSNRMFD